MREKSDVMNELKRLSTFNTFGTKKEVNYLPEILNPDEHILSLISGFLDGNTWVIALTEERLIFLDKGMFYGLKQREIPLDKINSISQKRGLLLGSVTIQDGATAIKIDNIDKAVIGPFIDSLNNAIKSFKSPIVKSKARKDTSIDDLLKLKMLLDEGVLSQEEFDFKKKQLLGL